MVTGDPIHYVSSGGSITPRLADDILYRHAHPEQKPKPTGLDWNALTPTCSSCSAKSGQIDGTGLCPTCRGAATTIERTDVESTAYASYQTLDAEDVTKRFTAPTQTPQAAATAPAPVIETPMVEPEATTTTAATVAPPRPAVRAKVQRVGPHDVVITLHSIAEPIDHLAVAALLHNLLTQTPATAPRPSPVSGAVAGPKSEGARPVGKRAAHSDTPTRARRLMGQPPRERALSSRNINLPEARRLYLEEQFTCPQIATQLGSTPAGVRRALKADGVAMRDDRATNSGGRNKKTYDTALVDAVRRLYLDERLTIAEVAERLYTTPKVVGTVMRRNNIPSRPDAFTSEGHPHRDNAGALKEQIRALGVTSLQIKTWALHQGLIERITRGVPKQVLVDAYAAAHPTTSSTTTTEGDTAA